MTTRADPTRWLIPLLVIALLACLPAIAWEPSAEVREVLNAAKRRDPSIPGQAHALINLAWGPDTESPLVRAAARAELAGFGRYALQPIRERFRTIDSRFQADVVEVFAEARFRVRSDLPPEFLAGLDEMIWFGSREARRLALGELSRYRYPPAVLTMIDATREDPALFYPTLRALGRIRDDRSTIFLGRALRDTDPSISLAAARTMGQVGGRAKATLRELVAATDDTPAALRRSAVEGLLVRLEPDDLASLNAFLEDHLDVSDDDLVDRARLAAADLELRLEKIPVPEF